MLWLPVHHISRRLNLDLNLKKKAGIRTRTEMICQALLTPAAVVSFVLLALNGVGVCAEDDEFNVEVDL